MRYIITLDTEESSEVSVRFGRAPYFLVVDDDARRVIENEGHKQEHGAGIRAAQQVMDLAPDVLMTGRLGPKAEQVLSQSDVRVVYTRGSVEDALARQAEPERDTEEAPIAESDAQASAAHTADGSDSKKVLIPVSDNSGRDAQVCDHFGHAPYFAIYDATLRFINNELDHGAQRSPVQQLVESVGPDIVVVKGIGQRAIRLFGEHGVTLKTAEHETVGKILDNLENLPDEVTDCGH